MKNILRASLLAGTALFSVTVAADDFLVKAPIDKVVVYREGATVTRIAAVQLPAGRHTITVDQLTSDLDDGSRPTVSFKGGGVHVLGLSLGTSYTEIPASTSQADLQAQIYALHEQAAGMADQIKAKELQLDFVRGLISSRKSKDVAALAIADWDRALAFVGDQSSALLLDIQKISKDRRALHKKIEVLKREKAATGPEREDYSKIEITAQNDVAREVTFELSYFVEDASWALDVTADLQTEAKTLALKTSAVITQESGENWDNVTLALSNNEPSEQLGNVDQESVVLKLAEPKARRGYVNRPSNSRYEADKRAASPVFDIEEVVVTSSLISAANTQFNRLYTLKDRTSVTSTGEKELVEIVSGQTDATLIVRSVPYQGARAFLFVDTTLKAFEPARTFNAILSRDGQYVGSGNWPALENDTLLKLPYGEDQAVSITHIELPDKESESGFINRDKVERKRFLITVTNFHSEPTTVEIFDRIPVSGEEDIKVQTLRGATPASEKDMDGKEGLMMWRKTLAAGEVWEIKHHYRITYPADKAIVQK